MTRDGGCMYRIHGIWKDSRLHVWGERPETTSAPIERTELQSPATIDVGTGTATMARPRAAVRVDSALHPYAMSVRELHAALGEISPDGLLATIATEDELHLWLPAGSNGPMPSTQESPEQYSDNPEFTQNGIGRFRAASLSFEPADAIDLLTSITSGHSERIGSTLLFWQALAKFGLSLLARQQFAPGVEAAGANRFEGRWSVFVADAEELAWLDHLARAMPDACRAFDIEDREKAEASRLVDGFLTATCEALIRRSLESDEFYRDFHERAANESKWEVAWISSLVGDRRAETWQAEDASEIAAQIRAWSARTDQDETDSHGELSFTLIEPEAAQDDNEVSTGNESWRVQIELRSTDTGEATDIRKILQERSEGASILARHLSSRGEHLRGELTRASRTFPELRAILDGTPSNEVVLSTPEAHHFLRDRAPMLLTEGFNVELPEWAQSRQRRFGLEMVLKPRENRTLEEELSLGSFGLTSMIDFDWRVAVGDERLSPAEFEMLVARRTPLVRLRGQWIDVDQIAADKARAFMQSRGQGALTLVQAMRLAAGVDEEDTGLPIVGLAGSSWLDHLLNEMPETRVEKLGQPDDFNGTLRPYQIRGLEWLSFLNKLGIGACLADDMGLGKTIQFIALLLHERRLYPDVGPTLLFVPMSVVGNWQRELQRFANPLKVLVHHGPERITGDAFVDAAGKNHVVITTYGLAHRDSKVLSRVNWHRIALDEAQKIKNPGANQTIAIRALPTLHRVALTGTPLENHLSELWSIMETLNPGLLGSATQFRKQFAIPIEKMGDQQRAGQLRRMIRPFVLRRLKNDPSVECDLPEKMEMRVFCNLTPEQAALYKETVQQMLGEIDQAAGIRRRGLILATLTKLKQICNHPAHFLKEDGELDGRSGKCERIVEMLEEVLEEGDAALIFTQYRVMGDLLKKLFEERLQAKTLFLHGGTPAKQRDELVDTFQNPKGDARLFLLSLKAGGFGLNLTRANHVFHFDRWWNPAVEQQATDRAHRIGQTRRVQVHKFVCIGTIEDRIDKLLTEKSALADHIVGSGDEWLTGLSTTELRDYLTLSADAVTDD
ncbi:MAG: DEAD/DEAH box helicase [Planctomycetes bacterium]|nr:DEAD/DEAH box helicase [Planctomycetota bacterium]